VRSKQDSVSDIPGRLLTVEECEAIQKRFVDAFVPEMLPRLSPPYWGAAFEAARACSSDDLTTREFLDGEPVWCMPSSTSTRKGPRFRRDVYVMERSEAATYACSLTPASGHDVYLFDSTFSWFISILEERIFQADEDGKYVVLCYRR
jgi:hypothetical protein